MLSLNTVIVHRVCHHYTLPWYICCHCTIVITIHCHCTFHHYTVTLSLYICHRYTLSFYMSSLYTIVSNVHCKLYSYTLFTTLKCIDSIHSLIRTQKCVSLHVSPNLLSESDIVQLRGSRHKSNAASPLKFIYGLLNSSSCHAIYVHV